MTYLNSVSFQNYTVTLEVDDTSSVTFYVNDSFSVDSENPHKVAITKWLLKEFKNICRHYTYLWCSAYGDDNHQQNRIKAFKKAGFIPLKGGYFLWTNFSSKEKEEEFVRTLVKEYSRLIFYEESEKIRYVDINIPNLGFYKAEALPCKE